MKRSANVVFVCLLLAFSVHVNGDNIYRHKIAEKDATELNKLGNSIGITGKTGWPVNSEEKENSPIDVWGVEFEHTETKKRKEGNDSIFVQYYSVLKIKLNEGLSGTLPEIELNRCIDFNLRGNQISGTIPDLKLPVCQKLWLGFNQFSGELPDLNLPMLEVLDLEYNKLSGEIRNFTKMPELKYLNIQNNEFTSIVSEFSHPNLIELSYSGHGEKKFTGKLPAINCPNLEILGLSGHNFSGEIPNYNLPKCKSISLIYNKLTGNIPEFNLPALESLSLYSNKLSGEIPSFSGLPSLKSLDLGVNQFSSINAGINLPNLLTFDVHANVLEGELPNLKMPNLINLYGYDNKLSGKIPALNMMYLKELDLSRNNFSGELPMFNMPSLEYLNISYNKLTGAIPDFNMPLLVKYQLQYNLLSGPLPNLKMPKLTHLILKFNQIEGTLPQLNLPSLIELSLEYNKISGSLPEMTLPQVGIFNLTSNELSEPLGKLNLPKAYYIDLSYNKIKGNFPQLKIPAAKELILASNKFEGRIPKIDHPLLTSFHVTNNNFEGYFDNSGLPMLNSLGLGQNQFDSIPNLRNGSPNINSANVRNNKLKFNHIEPNIGIRNFWYSNQDSIDHYLESVGVLSRLYVKTGGTANKYQWMKKSGFSWIEIPGATSDSYTVNYVEGDVYTCKITNTIAPDLTLYSRLAKSSQCFSLGLLEFCNNSNPWKSEKKNELKATGIITINDFLNFEGSITIDTAQLNIVANGSFYFDEIPLPGMDRIGKFVLAAGEYNLRILGDSGMITEFGNSTFKELADVAGFKLKVKKVKLVGGRKAEGIEMDCKIAIPGITGKCDEDASPDQSAEVELKGLKITKSGVSMKGVKIENMSMFVKGFCLKELLVDYNSKEDIIRAGAALQLPFGEVGGGFKLSKGFLDSIAWRLEAAKPPFVLGATTIGVKGFFGQISSITEPNIEVELGGIFTDIVSDKFYLIDASGRTIWPTLFEIKGSGKFMKPPVLNFPYQLNADVSMSYDFPLNQFKVAFDGKVGTADDKKWLMKATGDYKMSLKYPYPKYAGNLSGEIELPEMTYKFPINWLKSMFSFPIKGAANATFVWGNSQLLHGNAIFKSSKYGPFSLRFVVDLSKEYGSDDFLWFESDITIKTFKQKCGIIGKLDIEEIHIPSGVEYVVIGILSPDKASGSTLENPSGKVLSNTSETDKVVLTTSDDGREAFWTISEPKQGNWKLVLQNQGNSDSVIVFFQKKPTDFKINLQQTGKNFTVTWDGTLFTDNDTIYTMLDDDDSGFDGFAVADALANSGSMSFHLTDSLSLCKYYLFAQVSSEYQTYREYSNNYLNIEKTILMAPDNFTAVYMATSGLTEIRYPDNKDDTTVGYAISVSGTNSTDSVIAIVPNAEGSVQLYISDYQNSVIKLTAFDRNGLMGCPTATKAIITDIAQDRKETYIHENITFFPNPTNGRGTIRYTLRNQGNFEIIVLDITGRIVQKPFSGKAAAGIYDMEWHFGDLPNGIYLIILRTDSGYKTTRCILSK